jgi:hypothetical protein
MGRKKTTATAPASPPPAAPSRKTRTKVPARTRAIEAYKTAALALTGHPLFAPTEALALRVAAEVPVDWEPKRAAAEPLKAGDYARAAAEVTFQPRYRAMGGAVGKVVAIYKDGRSLRCDVDVLDEDEDGKPMKVRATGLLVADMRRAAPPEPNADAPIPYRLTDAGGDEPADPVAGEGV